MEHVREDDREVRPKHFEFPVKITGRVVVMIKTSPSW
jgi:hypothetical protein